jgi:hypothetical protein
MSIKASSGGARAAATMKPDGATYKSLFQGCTCGEILLKYKKKIIFPVSIAPPWLHVDPPLKARTPHPPNDPKLFQRAYLARRV